MHLLSQVVIFLHFPFENIWINEHKGNLTDDFGISIHEEVFSIKFISEMQILPYGKFTLKGNQNQYSFLEKEQQKKGVVSLRV